jgi:hypothetical protein
MNIDMCDVSGSQAGQCQWGMIKSLKYPRMLGVSGRFGEAVRQVMGWRNYWPKDGPLLPLFRDTLAQWPNYRRLVTSWEWKRIVSLAVYTILPVQCKNEHTRERHHLVLLTLSLLSSQTPHISLGILADAIPPFSTTPRPTPLLYPHCIQHRPPFNR